MTFNEIKEKFEDVFKEMESSGDRKQDLLNYFVEGYRLCEKDNGLYKEPEQMEDNDYVAK